MSTIYTPEIFYSFPVPADGVSFGSVNANGITTLLSVNNLIFGGSYCFDTVTITLKGIGVPPFIKPLATTIANTSFSFRNRTWTLIDVAEGNKFKVGQSNKYDSWSCTGIDLLNPRVRVS